MINERDDRFEPHSWVHRANVRLGKTKLTVGKPIWSSLLDKNASETVMIQYEDATNWVGIDNSFDTYNKKQKAFDGINKWRKIFDLLHSNNEKSKHDLSLLAIEYNKNIKSNNGRVSNTEMSIPFGFVKTGYGIATLCLLSNELLPVLASYVKQKAEKDFLLDNYIQKFYYKSDGTKRFERVMCDADRWTVYRTEGVFINNNHPFFCSSKSGREYCAITYFNRDIYKHTPLTSDRLAIYLNEDKDYHNSTEKHYLAVDLQNNDFKILDEITNTRLPDGYDPHKAYRLKAETKEGDELVFCDIVKHNNESYSAFEKTGFKSLDFHPWHNNSSTIHYTKEDAIKEGCKDDGKWVLSSEVLDLPQPWDKDVIRYYLVEENDSP